MLKLKELLAKLVKNQDFTPIRRTWSNVSVSGSTGGYQTLVSITIPAHSQYLIFGSNGNAIGSAAACNIQLSSSSGMYSHNTFSNNGSGNPTVAIGFIATGDNPATVEVQTYKYQVTGTPKYTGGIVAIPLLGGGIALKRLISTVIHFLGGGRHAEIKGATCESAQPNGESYLAKLFRDKDYSVPRIFRPRSLRCKRNYNKRHNLNLGYELRGGICCNRSRKPYLADRDGWSDNNQPYGQNNLYTLTSDWGWCYA